MPRLGFEKWVSQVRSTSPLLDAMVDGFLRNPTITAVLERIYEDDIEPELLLRVYIEQRCEVNLLAEAVKDGRAYNSIFRPAAKGG